MSQKKKKSGLVHAMWRNGPHLKLQQLRNSLQRSTLSADGCNPAFPDVATSRCNIMILFIPPSPVCCNNYGTRFTASNPALPDVATSRCNIMILLSRLPLSVATITELASLPAIPPSRMLQHHDTLSRLPLSVATITEPTPLPAISPSRMLQHHVATS